MEAEHGLGIPSEVLIFWPFELNLPFLNCPLIFKKPLVLYTVCTYDA